MRVVMTVATAALALFTASGASAQLAQTAPENEIQDFCIQTGAQMGPALAKADANGWITVSKNAAPLPPSAGFKLDDYGVRMFMKGETKKILIAGRAKFPTSGTELPADVCLVVDTPADLAAQERFKAWIGVEPMMTMPQGAMAIYLFSDSPTGHKAGVANGSGEADMLAGRMKMALFMNQPASHASALGYFVIHAANKSPDAPSTASH